MAKVVNDTKINDLVTSWENYTGQRVEELIKEYLGNHEESIQDLDLNKFGFVAIVQADDTKYYHLLFFAKSSDYVEWSDPSNDDPNKDNLVLGDIEIPLTNDTGVQDIITLTRLSDANIAVSKPSASVTVLYKWEQFNPLNQSTSLMDEDATVTVSVRMQLDNGSWGGWLSDKEFVVTGVSSGTPKTIDLSSVLTSDGLYQIRLTAIGDNRSHVSSPVTMTILYSNINLSYKGDISAAFTGSSFNLPFGISGRKERRLTIRINGYEKNYGLGTTPYTENNYQAECKLNEFRLERGAVEAEAWVSFGDNFSSRTETIKFQFIYVPEGDEETTPIIAVTDVKENLINWSYEEIFKYGVYNPLATQTPVIIRLVDRDTAETYIETRYDVNNNDPKTYSENLAIEPNVVDVPKIINAQIQFTDLNGISYGNDINVTIDNHENFSATSGVTFLIQPDRETIKAGSTIYEYNDCIDEIIDTNSGWGVSEEVDSENVKVKVPILSVGAGNRLRIPYQVFNSNTGFYTGGIEGSTTIEFDIRVSNIVADNNPIIDLSVPYVDEYVGVRVYPTKVVCLSRDNNKPSLCDVGFQEDEREHIAINIIRNLADSGINYVRIYINGKCNREFVYKDTDGFVPLVGGGSENIIFGSDDADLDIFGVRIYKGVQLSSIDIQNDYMSSMPTITDKKLFKTYNSIYNGVSIEYQTCLNLGYNTILRKIPAGGHYPSFDNPDKQKGVDVVVNIFERKGDPDSLDKRHSGTFHNMTIKGQGTSAKGYYWWNITDGFENDVEIEDVNNYDSSDPTHYTKKGVYYKKKSYFISKDCDELGSDGYQYYTSDYEIEDERQSGIPGGRKGITKLNGKCNYASMQQSHKLGNIWLYDELWQRLVNKGSNGRVVLPGHACCYEKPFLVFYQIEGDSNYSEPTFCGFQTWGSAKGDKKTFGFDKSASPGYMCVSGADNGSVAALFQIPIIVEQGEDDLWTGNIAYKRVTINTGDIKNGYCYKDGSSDTLSFEVEIANKYDGGETNEKWGSYVRGEDELKGASETTFMVDFAKFTQFVCACSPLLEPWEGTVQDLLNATTGVKTDHQYWITSGIDRYRVFYYNPAEGHFEEMNFIPSPDPGNGNAIWGEDGRHTKLGVMKLDEQLAGMNVNVPTVNGFKSTPIMEALTRGDIYVQTEYLSQARVEYFKAHIESYADILDAIYHQCWVRLEAATDNRAKNTYPWIDGTVDKLVRWKQDDMDTVKNTDNQGQLTKPYHILEHSKDGNKNYWNGENNVFFTLIERAYPDRMKNMMRDMFAEMSQISGSVFKYYEDRFFWVQRYFPASAYNETIKLLYEKAKILFDQGHGYSQDPISQAIGDQLESEIQYIKQRLPMLMSWCEYEQLDDRGTLSFRSVPALGAAPGEDKVTYTLEYTAYQYIYPKLSAGGTMATLYYKDGNDNWVKYTDELDRYRCAPGETVKMVLNTGTNTQFTLQWLNYAQEIGNLGQLPCAEEGDVTISGKRLRKLDISSPTPGTNEFNPNGVVLVCRNLESLDFTNANNFSGNFDFNLPRCKSIKLIGTRYTTVTVPKTSALEYLSIPDTLYQTEISAQPNLAQFVYNTATGLQQIQILKIKGQHKLGTLTYTIAAKLNSIKPQSLNTLVLNGINWTSENNVNVSASVIDYLATIPNIDLKGEIEFTSPSDMTYSRKVNYINKWGNIDNPDNDLHMIYTQSEVNSIDISGSNYIGSTGNYQYKIVPYDKFGNVSTNGNDFIGVTWGFTDTFSNGQNTIDQNGVLHVNVIGTFRPEFDDDGHEIKGTGRDDYGTITGTLHKSDGSTKVKNLKVYLFQRDAYIGDFVYADGTYSDIYDPGKTVIGVCFYVNPDDPTERLAVASKYAGTTVWGLYSSDNNSNGFVSIACEPPLATNYFNINSLPDISGNGCPNDTQNIKDNAFYATAVEDGFRTLKSNTASNNYHVTESGSSGKAAALVGFVTTTTALIDNQDYPSQYAVYNEDNQRYEIPIGTRIPWGYAFTLNIINHRNSILPNLVTETSDDGEGNIIVVNKGIGIPGDDPNQTEWNHLNSLMNQLVANNSNLNKYAQFYYPAASKCYAYAPATANGGPALMDGEEVSEKFAPHNWFLPASGDVALLYYYHYNNNRGYNDESSIFYEATNSGKFSVFSGSSYHWSSTEYTYNHAWLVYFQTGGFNTYGYYGKCNGNSVRPCVAF